jgi:hypothetical protein
MSFLELKRYKTQLIVLMCSMIFSLCIVEIALTMSESNQQAQSRKNKMALLQPHSSGSYRLRPGYQGKRSVDGEEINIRINKQGMHWRSFDPLQPKTKQRVAVVGDSFAFGSWSADYEKSFVGVLDQKINNQGFEVLNFGVCGYGVDDIELLIPEKVINFDPDYVILAFFSGNDFRDTYLGLDKYVLREGTAQFDPALLKRLIPAEYRSASAKQQLPLATLRLLKRLALKFAEPSPEIPSAPVVPGGSALKLGFRVDSSFTSFTFWSRDPYPAVATKAIEITLERIESIRRMLASNGPKFMIANLPYQEQVYVKEMQGSGYNVERPQCYLQDYAIDNDIPYLDLLPPLRDNVRINSKKIYVTGDPHFNTSGHKIVGNLLAQWFLQQVSSKWNN